MKIVQLTHRFFPALGGVETHVMHLSTRLAAMGVSSEIYTTDVRKDVPFERLNGAEVSVPFPVRRFRALRLMELPNGLGTVAPLMVKGVLGNQFDLLHAHAYGHFPTLVGALAELIRDVPLVVTPHSDPGRPTISKRLFDFVIPPLTLRLAQRVIALTRIEAHYLAALGIPRPRIRVIPNGIDLNEFATSTLPRRARNGSHVLFVGRIYLRQKGLEVLIRALSLLPSELHWRLSIVGEDWGGVETLRLLAARLGVEHQVAFVGPVDRQNLLRYYAAADVVVLPSFFEPFGIVLLEAMAAGIPVVASKVGGIPEVVDEGRTGLLVPPGDDEKLASALESILSNPLYGHEMGQRGRDRATAFSWDVLAPKIVTVYEEAIDVCEGS